MAKKEITGGQRQMPANALTVKVNKVDRVSVLQISNRRASRVPMVYATAARVDLVVHRDPRRSVYVGRIMMTMRTAVVQQLRVIRKAFGSIED